MAARTAGGAPVGCARRARLRGCRGPTHSASRLRVGFVRCVVRRPWWSVLSAWRSAVEYATTLATPRTSAPALRRSSRRVCVDAPSAVAAACDAANAASSSPHMASASKTPAATSSAHAPHVSSTHAGGVPTKHRRSAFSGRWHRPERITATTPRAATRWIDGWGADSTYVRSASASASPPPRGPMCVLHPRRPHRVPP